MIQSCKNKVFRFESNTTYAKRGIYKAFKVLTHHRIFGAYGLFVKEHVFLTRNFRSVWTLVKEHVFRTLGRESGTENVGEISWGLSSTAFFGTCFGSICSFLHLRLSHPGFDVCQKKIFGSVDQNIKDGERSFRFCLHLWFSQSVANFGTKISMQSEREKCLFEIDFWGGFSWLKVFTMSSSIALVFLIADKK
ncbi:hypothetical protein CEXT_11211 [Caerostris extrusa]|uniref:Uncharacterized protein n=1 Tax=Caerostris extrusa TaxID=172846 RepID=A0AAV4XIV2_CAEEX|nr:hypothetical protein CEXT_11211 [Caerostris extrusa]